MTDVTRCNWLGWAELQRSQRWKPSSSARDSLRVGFRDQFATFCDPQNALGLRPAAACLIRYDPQDALLVLKLVDVFVACCSHSRHGRIYDFYDFYDFYDALYRQS